MAREPKTIKFQLMLSETEAKAIDDWGFDNRYRTRAEVIRKLCDLALRIDKNFDVVLDLGSRMKEDGSLSATKVLSQLEALWPPEGMTVSDFYDADEKDKV